MADRATAPNIETGVIGDINPTPYEIIFSIPISDTDFKVLLLYYNLPFYDYV